VWLYLGDGDDDRRESFHDGRAVRNELPPLGGDVFRGHQMRGQESGSVPFLASDIPIFVV